MKMSRGIFLPLALIVMLAVSGCVVPEAAPAAPAAPAEEAAEGAARTYEDLVVGFSQIGAESEWRTAETESIKSTAEELGVELKFSDAQQKQENQIKAIRSFIAQGVDVIGLRTCGRFRLGDRSSRRAKDAGIPVILVDREVDVSAKTCMRRSSVRTSCWEGATRAVTYGREYLEGKRKRLSSCKAPLGFAPATDRMTGFRRVAEEYPEMSIIATQTGDFTRAKGKEVMEAFLKTRRRGHHGAVRPQR